MLTARCSPITLQPFPVGKACCEHRRLASRTLTFFAHFIVAMNRGRGRYRDEGVRAVARTAEALKPLARGVAEALKPHLPRLGQKMRDLDLEPENEEYSASLKPPQTWRRIRMAQPSTAPSSWRSVTCLTTSGRCCETRFGAVSTAHWPAATDASNARN